MLARSVTALLVTTLLAAARATSDTRTPPPGTEPAADTSAAASGEDAGRQDTSATSADATADAPETTADTSAGVAGASEDGNAVVLDPRETGQLRNFLGYTFPPAPQVQTGPLQRAALNDLNMIWSGLQRGGISGDAIARLGQTGDPRLGWIVSDLLRFIPPGELTDGAISAFQSLTGVRLADDPVALRSPWQSVTDHLLAWDLPVFDGYAEYKERLFTLVEPGCQPFFDDVDSDIDWRIVSRGGVLIDNRELGDPRLCPRGCIPALDNPGVTDVEGGSWYPDDGIVFAVVLGGEARAHPRHIMEIHEMINDTLGGRDDNGPIFPVGDVDDRLSVQDQVFGVVLDDGTPVAFPVDTAVAELEAGGTVELSGVTLQLDAAGEPIEGHQSFWFAWSQFMADTLLWTL